MEEYIKRKKGIAAEKFAWRLLKKKGYRLIKKNFSCKTGEIDLIVYDPEFKEVVFVEVRFRDSSIEDAIESINYVKQKKIRRTAEYFLMISTKYQEAFTRFDVVAISLNEKKKFISKHIPDAFRD